MRGVSVTSVTSPGYRFMCTTMGDPPSRIGGTWRSDGSDGNRVSGGDAPRPFASTRGLFFKCNQQLDSGDFYNRVLIPSVVRSFGGRALEGALECPADTG